MTAGTDYTYSSNAKKEEVTGVRESDVYTDDFGSFIIKNVENKTRLYKKKQSNHSSLLSMARKPSIIRTY